MNLNEIVKQDQRLVILQVLNQDVGFSHNQFVLQEALKQLGHSISQDLVTTQLHWLQEQNLITLITADTLVAKLTSRGKDVADGVAVSAGVKKARP